MDPGFGYRLIRQATKCQEGEWRHHGGGNRLDRRKRLHAVAEMQADDHALQRIKDQESHEIPATSRRFHALEAVMKNQREDQSGNEG
ncbi:hypothetical protein D3C80_1456590 [compost metagenome]